METGQGRGVDNTPHWLSKSREDKPTKKQRLFLLKGAIFSMPASSTTRAIPLKVDNKLPAIEIRFGTSDDNEVAFLCHLDSCAGMNTANLLLHQWMITNHPEIVISYEEYTDSNPFTPLKLDCAIPTNEKDDNCDGQLTAVVTYRTRYLLPDGTNATVTFGLGKDIQVNAILGITQLKDWRMVLNLDESCCASKVLSMWFPLHFDDAASGMPSHVEFTSNEFKRPAQVNPTGELLHLKTSIPGKLA